MAGFPKRRDPTYMDWLRHQLLSVVDCDADCGKIATERAHLIPKSRGGDDRMNVSLLCHGCHEKQEKRTDRFCIETGVGLHRKAENWTKKYRTEVSLPF